MEPLQIPEDWTATEESIIALPRPLRRYIHDLQKNVDFAGTLLENAQLRRQNASLRKECERLAGRGQAPGITRKSRSG
jgi:hypothetical protein